MVDEDAGAMGVMVVSHVGSLGLPHLSYGCDDVEDGGRAKAQQPQLHRVPSSTQCKSLHTEEQIANDKIFNAWGCQVSTGDSEALNAYRGPCTALSSLENTIANSELALAA